MKNPVVLVVSTISSPNGHPDTRKPEWKFGSVNLYRFSPAGTSRGGVLKCTCEDQTKGEKKRWEEAEEDQNQEQAQNQEDQKNNNSETKK